MTNDTIGRRHDTLLHEVTILVEAIQCNLDLLSYLVKDLLQGETDTFANNEETLARAVDEVLYHASIAALEVLHIMNEETATMAPQTRSRLATLNEEYDRLTDRWRSLMESVHEIYNLRTPCQ